MRMTVTMITTGDSSTSEPRRRVMPGDVDDAGLILLSHLTQFADTV